MQVEITPEHRAEIDAFLADSRTLRFIESDPNWTALGNFLDDHSLPTDRESMVYAYETLVKQGALELVPFATPVPAPEPEPAPVAAQAVMPAPAVPQRWQFIRYKNGRPV